MSKQRFRLAEYYQEGSKFYHATFDHLTHKVNQQGKKIPTILLKNVYLVNSQDKKIALRKANDFVDEKGRHIVADHLWVKLTKPWFDLPVELVKGDEIYFSAEVKPYKINRTDILRKREQIWSDAKKMSNKIYQRWAKYTDSHKRKNFQLSLTKMKQKQREIMNKAKKEQKNLKLVDYSLTRIKNIKVVALVKTKDSFIRKHYCYTRYKQQGYKYTAWVAYRSIEYASKTKKIIA